jgi:hypothetical protein
MLTGNFPGIHASRPIGQNITPAILVRFLSLGGFTRSIKIFIMIPHPAHICFENRCYRWIRHHNPIIQYVVFSPRKGKDLLSLPGTSRQILLYDKTGTIPV